MSAVSPNTIITVRKPDGTFVKMTLAELNNVKKQPTPVATNKPVAPIPAPKSATPTVSKIAKIVTDDFASSLLEEAPPPANPALPLTSPGRVEEVDKLLNKLNFNLSEEGRKRLRSFIQLKLKDIRTSEQTKEALMKPWERGGMGLAMPQAEQVIKLCEGSSAESDNLPPPALKTNLVSSSFILPAKPTSEVVKPATNQTPLYPQRSATPFKLNSEPAAKPVVKDVSERSAPIGPVEEIQSFTLADFRRLAPTASEAASRLKQKFINLKEESILLFLSGIEAWRKSPLYKDYLNLVNESLASGRPMAVNGDKQRVQLVEIKAITEMERQLNL